MRLYLFPKKIKLKKKSHFTRPRGPASSYTKSCAIFVTGRKARGPPDWEDKGQWQNPNNSGEFPQITRHKGSADRHHDGQGHSCSEKQECFVAQPSSFIEEPLANTLTCLITWRSIWLLKSLWDQPLQYPLFQEAHCSHRQITFA